MWLRPCRGGNHDCRIMYYFKVLLFRASHVETWHARAIEVFICFICRMGRWVHADIYVYVTTLWCRALLYMDTCLAYLQTCRFHRSVITVTKQCLFDVNRPNEQRTVHYPVRSYGVPSLAVGFELCPEQSVLGSVCQASVSSSRKHTVLLPTTVGPKTKNVSYGTRYNTCQVGSTIVVVLRVPCINQFVLWKPRLCSRAQDFSGQSPPQPAKLGTP